MKCEAAQEWLLQCESLQPKSWPRGVVKHLRVCTSCYQFGKSIKRLERAWRNLPLPDECDAAKVNFLAKLAALHQPENPRPRRDRRAKKLAPPRKPVWGMRWLAAAACLFIGIIGVGLLVPGRRSTDNNISASVVDRLVDWNVALVNAEPNKRKELLEEYEGYSGELKKARPVLAPEECQLGEDLLESGRLLAIAEDPLAEAEAVTAIANKLFAHAAVAVEKGTEKDAERCGMRYSRFNAFAVRPMWNRLDQFKSPDKNVGVDKDKNGFDKDKGGSKGIDKSSVEQKRQFDALRQRSPEVSRPDLYKKFDMLSKKGGPSAPTTGPAISPKAPKKQ